MPLNSDILELLAQPEESIYKADIRISLKPLPMRPEQPYKLRRVLRAYLQPIQLDIFK